MKPSTPHTSNALDPKVVTLDDDDLAAMPESLRATFTVWVQQRRATQAKAQVQDTLNVPPVVGIEPLTRATLLAIHGGLDAAHWQTWLDRYPTTETNSLQGPRLRMQLLELVVEARRLDLLTAMLDHPLLLPVLPPKEPGVKPALPPRFHSRRVIRQFFNGQLLDGQRRAANATGPGMAFLERLEEQRDALVREESPLAKVANAVATSRERQLAQLEIHHRTSSSSQRVALKAPRSMQPWLKQAVGARLVKHLNLVGLAVLHGWPEGVARLLDAGVDPYAVGSSRSMFHSALMLAAVFDEPACAKVLIEHPSFSATARYGYVAADVAKRGYDPVAASNGDSNYLWRSIAPVAGGFDWNLVCRSALMQAPEVRSALWSRWQGVKPSARQRLLTDEPEAARRWEEIPLRAAIEAEHPEGDLIVRARSRL